MIIYKGSNRFGSMKNPVCQILNLRSVSLRERNLASRQQNDRTIPTFSNNFRYSNRMQSIAAPDPTHETNEMTQNYNNVAKYATEPLPVSADLIEQEKVNHLHSSNELRKRNKLKLNIQGEIVYGIHPVHLALHSKRRRMFQLYMYRKLARSDDLKGRIYQQAVDLGIPIKEVSRYTLSQLADGHVNQGVCLDASKLKMETFEENPTENASVEVNSFCLLLDRIQDPMNFGAVLRSCYYFGVNKVFTAKESSCKLTPVVSKASSGAMEILPVYAVNDLIAFLELKKERGWRIIGSDEYSTSPDQKCIGIDEIDVTKPTIFILGNEGTGIARNIYDLCDNVITIKPKQYPGIGSLNVSVVCGIVLHQLLGRQSSQLC